MGDDHFQLFSISQNPNDGSIYFSAPGFADIDWLVPAMSDDHRPVLVSYKAGGSGKLSLHGSGMVHVRPYDSVGRNEFAIRGHALKSPTGDSLGVRHLLTLFPPQPIHRPHSPAMARKSDGVFRSKHLHPYVILFWAVPTVDGLTFAVGGSFHVNDLEEVPPNSGWGAFNMLTHSVVWFAYRTKYMSHWPQNAQACYYDGHYVPLLIGIGEGAFRLELRLPTLKLTEKQLTIAV